MGILLELMQKLQDTHVAISHLEAALSRGPKDETLALTIKSLYKRQKDLEKAFSEKIKFAIRPERC